MAESVVEEPLAFFCHRCWIEIRPVLPSYVCPHCSSGFIEELDSTQTEQPSEADHVGEDMSIVINPAFGNILPRYPFRNILPRYQDIDMLTQRTRGGQALPDIAIRRGLDAIRDQIAELQRVDLYARDYAWNREGLDAIVTHLLNQMDVSGPPPLAKERIDEIPIVNVCQQQVDANLQCPVCWEDFRIEESVRKLMCEHYFHENCIIPWLELHGTCPVCRKWLFEENTNGESSIEESVNEASNGGGDLHRSNTLTTQLESLLSSGLNPIPVDTSDEPGTSTISSHDMGCG